MTSSTQDNSKLRQQLKSGFKRVISWNKYLSKPELLRQDSNLNHLVEPSFQGVNRLFVLAFENNTQRTSHSADARGNQQINFTANLDRTGAKETILDFSQGTVKVLQICY